MDRHVVAHSCQLPSLLYNSLGIFVTEQDKGDFCHASELLWLFVYSDKYECALNKPAFSGFLVLNIFLIDCPSKQGSRAEDYKLWVFPAHG